MIYNSAVGGDHQAPTIIVAASNSHNTGSADYVCDGVADQVEIQAAIDALPSDGGHLHLLEGIYHTTAAITIANSNVGITGAGFGTIIQPSAAVDYVLKFNPAGSSADRRMYNFVENLHLWLTGSVGGMDLNYVGDSGIREVLIASGGKAISATQLWGSYLDHVRISGCTYGIYFNTPTSDWSADTYLMNVAMYNCTTEYYAEASAAKHTKVVGALWESSTNGIVLNGESSMRISNSYISSPIDASDTDSRINIYNSWANGKIDLGKLSSVVASSVREVVTHGAFCQVSNNTFDGTSCDTEKLIDIQGDNTLVLANYFANNDAKYGVYCSGDHVTVSGNMFSSINSLNTWPNAAAIYIDNKSSIIAVDNHKSGSNSVFMDGDYSASRMYELRSDVFHDVVASSATYVVDSLDVSASGDVWHEPVAAKQPDVPRKLSWTFAQHTGVTEFDLVIAGIDARGDYLYETFTEADGWSGETSNAFAAIRVSEADEYIKYVRSAGAGDAGNIMNVGITDDIGLSETIDYTSDVLKIKKNNVNQTVAVAQVDTTYNIYDMSVIGVGAGDDFTVWYKNHLNMIS